MSHLYPLRLLPEFYERVWGSRDLTPLYSQPITGEPVGEVWLTGEKCKVSDGPLAGQSLAELSLRFGTELLGDVARDTSRFPLLLKFLFPLEKLSVQVHPDDEAAALVGQPCGKTECWYVLQARPGSQIGLGLKPGTSKKDVEKAIREIRMEQLLNWIDVHPGDMIYVDAGTVHTIGPGPILLETQQNSDTTYRLYDYGRPRELHIEEGLRAVKEWTHAGKVQKQQPRSEHGKSQLNLVSSPCFVVDKFSLSSPWEFQRPTHGRRSVWCLVGLRGSGLLISEGEEPVNFSYGQVVVIPASIDKFMLKPEGEMEFLCSSLPVEKVEHPKTVLVETAAGVTQ